MSKVELIKKVLDKYLSPLPEYSLADSKYLPRIFDMIVTEQDLQTLSHLPNTPGEISELMNISEKEAAHRLNDLYMRGFIWIEQITESGPRYCFGDIGLFMDVVLFDPRYDQYGDEFFDIWKKYWNEEHVHMYQGDHIFRVLPVEEVIRSTKIIPYERVTELLKNAKKIAVQRCACRVKERRCDNPLETCISIDGTADYIISRDIGREISFEQAIDLTKECEEMGLVHQTVNSSAPDVICNCCSCCCGLLRSVLYHGEEAALCKSRYLAVFDRKKCADCQDLVCVQKCVFGGITEKDGRLSIDPSRCWGCGLCARTCPCGAVTLKEVRKPNHIPDTKDKFHPFIAKQKNQ